MIGVWAESEDSTIIQKAQDLAVHLGLDYQPVHNQDPYQLVLTNSRLELRETDSPAGGVFVDFVGGTAQQRRKFGGGVGQELARAVGLKGGHRPQVTDISAGLGRDAFVLASLGCTVQLIERNPVVWALLQNGLERAAQDSEVAEITARMTLHLGSAQHWLPELNSEVIYFDPMYPAKRKAALPKKEMRLFHGIVGSDQDSAEVLQFARQYARRVTVKRPAGAESVGNLKPQAQISSKNTRFDIYLSV